MIDVFMLLKKFFILLIVIMGLAVIYVCPYRIGRLPKLPAEVSLKKPEIELIVDFADTQKTAVVETAADTPLQALELVASVKGWQLQIGEKNGKLKVFSVNKLFSTNSGWIYMVNNRKIKQSADQYRLKSGDKVLWKTE